MDVSKLRSRLLQGGVIPAHPLALTSERCLDETAQQGKFVAVPDRVTRPVGVAQRLAIGFGADVDATLQHQPVEPLRIVVQRHVAADAGGPRGHVRAAAEFDERREQRDGACVGRPLPGITLKIIALTDGPRCETRCVSSRVLFRGISVEEATTYWHSGEPQDKAGGYAIQGLGSVFVAGLNGSYSAVVGLPVCETAQLLAQFGIPCWQNLTAR